MDLMTINLRGTVFTTSHKTLQSVPNTVLSSLSEESEWYNAEKKEYYFDRNPAIFHNVLDYYTTGTLHIPNLICARSAKEELKFWEIPLKSVSKCCWKTLYQMDEDMDILEMILVRLHPDACSTASNPEASVMENSGKPRHRLQAKVWRLLTDFRSSILASVWHCVLTLVIAVSILTYALQTLEAFRVDRNHETKLHSNISSAKLRLFWNTSPHPALGALDFACNGILTLEFTLRFLTCPSKKAFCLNLLNIIDFISCAGIWIFLSVEIFHEAFEYGPVWIMSCVFGLLYSFRLLRVLRLARYNCGMQILLLSVKSSSRELALLTCAFGCFAVIFAGFMYVAELQVDTFSDMFITMWWSVITMTTVGYGDHVPTTGAGYVVGVACAMVGILLIALPVAVTSANFYEFYKFNRYRIRHNSILSKEEIGKVGEEACSKIKNRLIGSKKIKPCDS